MSSVLVTGGAGFIGSHLCEALLSQGARITCLDDLSTGRVGNVAHLNGQVFTGENKKMMNPGDDGEGAEVRVLSPVELGILEDLGYRVRQ